MSGDTTYQALKRLTFLPDRDDADNGNVIAGQEYYDVWFTGGSIYNVVLTDVTINGITTARAERIVTAPGNVTADVSDYVITIDKTVPEATTVLLPTDAVTSKSYIIKDGSGDAGANNITVDGDGITIDGQATYVIAASWGAVEIIFNGTEWNVLSAYRDIPSSGVVGPVSSTNNAIAVWDGISGGVLKNSGATVDGSGNLTANNFSGTSSGTNTGDQTITLTGDVTGSGTGSFAATIANAPLASIKGLTTAADLMIYTTAPNLYATTALTSQARTFLAAASTTDQRTALGLGTAAVQNIGTSGATLGLLNANKTDSGNNTFSGTATFSNANGVTTDTITERTAAAGVTIDGLLAKDGGVTFANGAGVLNWYETGSWTPIPYGGSTPGSPTGTFQGSFTRIGRQVFFDCYLAFTGLSTMAGQLRIDGLPYACAAAQAQRAFAGVSFRTAFTNDFSMNGQIVNNTNDIYMYRSDQDAVSLVITDLSATSQLYISGCYAV